MNKRAERLVSGTTNDVAVSVSSISAKSAGVVNWLSV
jgi:hypothetical protein